MFDFNGENLQVGDKVIVYVSYFSLCRYCGKKNSYRAIGYRVWGW